MALIDIRDLTFAYPGSYDNVFEHLSLQLDTRRRLGLVGRSDRDKTTLLRLLQRQYEYDGAISVPVPLDCFPSPVSVPKRDTLTILEEQEHGLELWRIYKELDALEVDAEVLFHPYSSLSGGEQVKVFLTAFFLHEGAFLPLDEPTNHLDLEGRRVVSRYLSRKSDFLLISHNRAFLDGCVDHIMITDKRNTEMRQGGFSAWWRDEQARDDQERAEDTRLGRRIGRLEGVARRTASWSDRVETAEKGCYNSGLRPNRGCLGHEAQKMMRRSKAVGARRTEAAEAKARLLKNIELAEAPRLRLLERPKRRLLEVKELVPDCGAGPVCRSVSFTVERGEQVALVGRNDSGKSSLLRLALGEKIPHTGFFSPALGLVVSYVPQDASFLRGSPGQFARRFELGETQFKTILRRLGFVRVRFEEDPSDYSAG